MLSDLANKKVIVTGSSAGIGLAVAKLFATLGATVAITSRRPPKDLDALLNDITQLGGKASYYCVDLSQEADCQKLVTAFVEEHGGIDILVNNVGGLVGRKQIPDIDQEFIEQVFDLNVISAQYMTKYALPYLQASAKQANWTSSVINVGSFAAYMGGGPGASLYAASKGWIHTITKSWAMAYAKDGIRFNVVSPGTVDTDFHADKDQATREAINKTIPLGRFGNAEEMAPAFAFLASHSAAGYITGQIINVNGGQYMP
ncbi:SDR family NAD(P)-dependent oxidoreductase [Spirabiliibacterium falconis]|uniref:SDR family NAD(P)-dependent oxidoreductase n=1 Tax=Spirabiliibacterium falconis TaxID=572023 RepID=UPI001AAC7839|nr:SDR family NAD(P)-dependent oxidoreductase [Spirabiliibacterium falconis]MBE2893504.1 SDR family oxidoreductase [Spirabiliibacterium falconis]